MAHDCTDGLTYCRRGELGLPSSLTHQQCEGNTGLAAPEELGPATSHPSSIVRHPSFIVRCPSGELGAGHCKAVLGCVKGAHGNSGTELEAQGKWWRAFG